MHLDIAGIPCDGAFLCGLIENIHELPIIKIIAYELVTVVPLLGVTLSYYKIYKRVI